MIRPIRLHFFVNLDRKNSFQKINKLYFCTSFICFWFISALFLDIREQCKGAKQVSNTCVRCFKSRYSCAKIYSLFIFRKEFFLSTYWQFNKNDKNIYMYNLTGLIIYFIEGRYQSKHKQMFGIEQEICHQM